MNSLKIKILGLTTVILILAIGVTSWHTLKTQQGYLTRITSQNLRLLGETIRNSLIASMAQGNNGQVLQVLEKIQREPAVEAVRIFDEEGRILLSGRPEEIGDRVSSADLLAFLSGRFSFSQRVGGKNLQSAILPIANASACQGCHDKGQEVLGVLGLQLSLGEMDLLRGQGQSSTLLTAGLMLLLALAISGFLFVYVNAPIRKLVMAMNHVEQGEFDEALTRIDSSAEMALLSSKFNLMVERLKKLIETTVAHEKELAITQEKLAHHDEIRQMNNTLEERFREIEYLNISLEERIEEIEEANYKIADLASDLETKNATLEQAVSRLSALYKMGLALNSTMELDRLFDLLIQKTKETLRARFGYILLLDRETWMLRIASAAGIPDHINRGMLVPLKEGGVSNWVINQVQPLLIPNIAEAGNFNRCSVLGFARETVICAPLTTKGEVIGTLTMANKEDGSPFTPEDLELLSTIAAQASVAIKNARLYEEQQRTYLSTVQALVSAVEASDSYTSGHSERVTRYSLVLAQALGLAPEALKRLEQAAILHDIGKIGIDVGLLNKAGKLSSRDIEILQQHPVIGVRILEPIHFLKEVRKIIEQHHERFDGTGYPKGIAGDDLLIEARILAVADTFDAMTSDRPYRKAIPRKETLREIELHAGSQFDPAITAAFIRLFSEGNPPL